MESEHFLVTGALGCIGAWTVAELLAAGAGVTAFDLAENPYRLRYLMDEATLAGVNRVQGDIADLSRLDQIVTREGITRIIHLAGLQVPFCQADPPLGGRVNVLGTLNVLEVARQQAGQVRQVVYASSAAVYGPREHYAPDRPVPVDAPLAPETHYGVYKRANESNARIYWESAGVSSVGLRPYIVYGVGRDQGLTSGASKAMLAAAAGRSFTIPHGGRADYQWARDVARTFIRCALSDQRGASLHNLHRNGIHVQDIVAAIDEAAPAARIDFAPDVVLPFPDTLDDGTLIAFLGSDPAPTPLNQAVQETVAHYRRLISAGLIDIERSLS